MIKRPRATIDFETRSSIDLKKVGAYRYAQNWDTSVLCLGYELPGQSVKLWHPGLPLPYDLFFWIADGGLVEAHNAEFEWAIWNYVQVRQGWPALSWKQLTCSAAQAAVMGLPRGLDSLCDVLNTEIKKDKDGKKIMLRVSKLKKPTTKEPDSWDDDPEKRQRLYAYNIDDVLAEKHASEQLYDLTPAEHQLFRHTAMINERGVYCDIKTCLRAGEYARRFERELLFDLRRVTEGKVKTAKQHARLLQFLNAEGLELLDLKAPTVKEELKRTDLTPKVRRALEIRATLNKSSLSKFDAMVRMSGPDQRIRGTLLHNGASTGRDTGRGIQPQNYIYDKTGQAKPDKIIAALNGLDYEDFKALYPNVFESLSYILRGMLCAAPGKKFVGADFASIEVRVLFWIAGHTKGLEIFYNAEDIYVQMAKAIYKLNDSDWEALSKEEKKEKRQLGKQAILGLGYGMGAKKFVITCAGYGIIITESFAKEVVKLYRALHGTIPKLWRDVEAAAIAAVQRPGKSFAAGKCRFFMRDRFLCVELPSKRLLYYCDPQTRESESAWGEPQMRLGYYAPNATTKSWQYEETYGGKFVENLVQAISADLMREAALRLEVKGFPIVMRVHDELIGEVDSDRDCLTEFEELMRTLPHWAEGCPVNVEGFEGPRYKK